MTTPGWRGWRIDGDLLVSAHSHTEWTDHSPLVLSDPQPGWPDKPGIYAWPDLTAARFAIAQWPVMGRVLLTGAVLEDEHTNIRDDQGQVHWETLPELRGTSCRIRYLLVDHRVPNPRALQARYRVPVCRFTTHDGMLPRVIDFCAAVWPDEDVRTEALDLANGLDAMDQLTTRLARGAT